MKKILLYGDSNTYGYDPRGMLGMRYPHEIIWPAVVGDKLGEEYEIIEEGQNGRPLPRLPYEEIFLKSMIKRLSADDIFVIMLGTNDILLTAYPNARAAVKKMEDFIEWMKREADGLRLIVIGPVYISGLSGELMEYHEASIEMNRGFEELCRQKGVDFWDAGQWGIPVAYDGVHFSEEGHRIFGERFVEELKEL